MVYSYRKNLLISQNKLKKCLPLKKNIKCIHFPRNVAQKASEPHTIARDLFSTFLQFFSSLSYWMSCLSMTQSTKLWSMWPDENGVWLAHCVWIPWETLKAWQKLCMGVPYIKFWSGHLIQSCVSLHQRRLKWQRCIHQAPTTPHDHGHLVLFCFKCKTSKHS